MKRLGVLVGIVIAVLMLYMGCAIAESGTFNGMDWDLTDGVLTLGKEGETQTLTASPYGEPYWPWHTHRSEITSVVTKGRIVANGSLGSMFTNCSALTYVDMSNWDMSNVTSLVRVFWNCGSLATIDVSGWDTSNVTNMERLFSGCKVLSTIDVANWNTSRVTTMECLFEYCSGLTSIDVSSFDTSVVTNMRAMFSGCQNIQYFGVAGWNVSNVENISSMFNYCKALTSLDLSGWNTSSLKYIEGFCSSCSSLVSINMAGWDTSHVNSMYNMFGYCSQLESVDFSGWVTSNVRSMRDMFCSCSVLTGVDVSGWNTSSVVTLRNMFKGCKKIDGLDVSRWDVSHVTDMGYLFSECENLTSLDVSTWNISSVTDMAYLFNHCSKLMSLDLSSFNTSQVTNMEKMFYVAGVTSLDLSGWDVSRVTTMNFMFCLCGNLEFIDFSGWTPVNVSDMTGNFAGAGKLKEVMLGDGNPFVGNGAFMVLPTPVSNDGINYTGKWIREDKLAGPYTPEELRDNYTSSMAGKWVWEKAPTEYSITFTCDEEGYIGDMPSVDVVASEAYVLPTNTFIVFGKVFDHWTDGTRRVYRDGDTIPANTYQANDVVTLTAVFAPRDTSIQMQNGQFTFSIKGDEKAFFDNVPAGTSYQIFEENIPEDWVLIMQSDGTGVITSLTESEAIFLNKYQPDLATIQFTGRKLMDEQPAEADSFTFELWEGNILLQTKSVMDGGFVQFDILEYGKNDVGIHTYTIKELIGTEESVLYDGHEETIAVEVITEEGSDNVTRVHAEVTYSDGTYPDIVFQNWTKPGELTLKKLVEDVLVGHEADEFKFRIRFVQENGLPLSEELTYSIDP